MKSTAEKKKLAHNYLDTLDIIKNLWVMGHDARHMDIERQEGYQTMLDATGKTAQEYPNGRKLALDILDGVL